MHQFGSDITAAFLRRSQCELPLISGACTAVRLSFSVCPAGRSYSIASRLDKSSEEDKGGGSSVPVGSAGMIHSPPGTEMPSFSFGK